jgi:hypothetical protein
MLFNQTMAIAEAEPCVSELVTSAAKELEDLEYDTFRANLKKSAEEYTAFVRSKLSMTRELASAGPLLIPDDLWSLLELEFTKADWWVHINLSQVSSQDSLFYSNRELARQDVLSRLKEIQSQPIEVTSSVINQINTNNIVTLGFADSLLHKHNYRTSDLEALASEMYSSWLGSDSVRLFDYLNSGPSTRSQLLTFPSLFTKGSCHNFFSAKARGLRQLCYRLSFGVMRLKKMCFNSPSWQC